MAVTITSSLVNAVLAGTYTIPVIPGKVFAVTANMPAAGKLQAGTITSGQVIQMVPVPFGARVLDIILQSEWPGNTAGVFTVGDGSLTNRFVTAASLTASSRVTKLSSNLAYRYSVSDDSTQRFDTIDINIGAGATQTATGSLLMTVYFRYEP